MVKDESKQTVTNASLKWPSMPQEYYSNRFTKGIQEPTGYYSVTQC